MAPRVTKKRSIAPQKQGQKAKHDIKRRKEVNVSGFQKRMAQKPPKVSDHLDVYEYDDKQRKGRSRAAVTLDLSKEEAREFAMEGDEDLDDLERLRQKLRMGEDLEIDSEDDEDIDSDDAFGASDEERFAGHSLKVCTLKRWTAPPD
jgi:U3 small nucleolar RNA-associated protein 14